jgi:hypothetical protein
MADGDAKAKDTGLEALVKAWLELGPNARRLLEYTADRLVIGKVHGDFDRPRDWDRETLEEEFDGAMYRAAKLLGFGRVPAQAPVCSPGCDCPQCAHAAAVSAANVPHSRAFFEQMKTCREAYKRLAIAFAVAIKSGWSVFDFGCGTGHQSAALARLGFRVVGADPLVRPEDVEPGFEFNSCDPITTRGFGRDVVICTEVAEHVYPERADALVEAVCIAAAERVVWSAARPGQDWEGHVNLQPPEYWISKFAARGFVVSDVATKHLRQAMRDLGAQHCGAADNFYVFDRKA